MLQRLNFIMVISIVLRRYFYIETATSFPRHGQKTAIRSNIMSVPQT